MPALLEQLESDRLSAIRTIDSEIETLNELKKSLDAESLTKALDFMQNAKGRIIITGMGENPVISGKKLQLLWLQQVLLRSLFILRKQATVIWG